jgi:hypothetical protein
MLLAGIGAIIAANVGYGLHAGITGALLSVWPVAAYVGCNGTAHLDAGQYRDAPAGAARICGCGSGCTR